MTMVYTPQIHGPKGVERFDGNPTAQAVWESMQGVLPGGEQEAAFREVVPVTPLLEVPTDKLPEDLRETAARIFIKHNGVLPGGAYKLRGATRKLLLHPGAEGAVTASTGNHVNELAIAGGRLGVNSVVGYHPADASPVKLQNVWKNGATPVAKPDLAVSILCAERHGRQPGWVFVHPFNDVDVIAGQGTTTAELPEQLATFGITPENSKITRLHPVGGGGNAGGSAVAGEVLLPGSKLRAVQAEGADGLAAKLNGREFDMNQFNNACDGAAVAEPGDLPVNILRDFAEAVDVVSHAQIGEAIAVLSRFTDTPEPAGALAFAGALQFLRANPGHDGVIVAELSGVNWTLDKIREYVGYALDGGLISGRTAFETLSKAHLERRVYGMEEIAARGEATPTQARYVGSLVASGPTAPGLRSTVTGK